MGGLSTVENPRRGLLEPCCLCHFHKIKRDDLDVRVSSVSGFPQVINELSRGAASMIRLRMRYLDILNELPELSPEMKLSSGLEQQMYLTCTYPFQLSIPSIECPNDGRQWNDIVSADNACIFSQYVLFHLQDPSLEICEVCGENSR